jgi:anti-anti-sigma factor
MNVERAANGVLVFRIVDDVDVANADALEEEMRRELEGYEAAQFVISFEACRYCDSSGLSVLVRLRRSYGDALAVAVAPDSQIRKVFELTGFAETFRVYPSTEAALEGTTR